MASLNVTVQASKLGNTLTQNIFNANDVIDVTNQSMKELNLLTFDNIQSAGNVVSTIQANCFLPVMYSPEQNPSYAYYGCSFPKEINNETRRYILQASTNTYVAWSDPTGQCTIYTESMPSSTNTQALQIYCDKCLRSCYQDVCVCYAELTNMPVADCYACNNKINEANIPYISADLITHGELPVSVIPKSTQITGDGNEDLTATLPTKGAVVDGISGMARAISYNEGVLALWGYGDDGKLYITSAVSLGTTDSVDNLTSDYFKCNYPLTEEA